MKGRSGRKRAGRSRQNNWSAVPPAIRKKLREHVFARDGYECKIRGVGCTKTAETLDHIVPRSIDPSRMLDPSNLRAACRNCNSSRGNDMVGVPSREW